MTDVTLWTTRLFVILQAVGIVAANLSFLKIKNLSYKNGKAQIFDCTLNMPSNTTIVWSKDGVKLKAASASFMNNRQIMKISNFNSRNSGLYKCVVKLKRKKVLERKFDIPPSEPPYIDYKDTIFNVKIGSEVKFKCFVTGSILSYDWYFNGKKLERNPVHHKVKQRKFFRLIKVAMSDAGQYTCSVINRAGQNEVTYHLKVIPRGNTSEELTPYLINNDSLAIAVVTSNINLDCRADGATPMNVSWFKNGVPIENENVRRTRRMKYELLHDNQTLRLNTLMLNDKGVFSCVVQNKYGGFQHKIRVVPQEQVSTLRPVFPATQQQIFYALPGQNRVINITLISFGNTHWELHFRYNKTNNSSSNQVRERLVPRSNVQMTYKHVNRKSERAAERLIIQYHFFNIEKTHFGSYFVRAGNSPMIEKQVVFNFTLIEGEAKKPTIKLNVLKSPIRSTSESWSQSAVFIVLMSVVGLFLVVVPVAVCIWCRHSKHTKNKTDLLSMERIDVILNIDKELNVTSLPLSRRLKFSTGRLSSCQTEKEYIYEGLPEDPDFEVDFDDIEFQGVLGEGAFGRVMLASVHGLPDQPSPLMVAVKMLKEDATERELKDLLSEIQVMKSMGRHENIINVLGVSSQKAHLCMLMEYCCHGNLRTFLKQRRPTFPPMPPPVEVLTRSHLVSFCLQVAKGMDYLAFKKCVHRDIAARNVLVADNYVVKIADFGLARDIQETDYYRKCTDGRLPVKWMAMEALFDRVYTTQSDIWSFGILAWEIVTFGGSPYPGVPLERLFELLKQGYRMEQPVNCSDEMYNIMLNCWKELPTNRPTFSELIHDLEKMLLDITDEDDYILQPPIISTCSEVNSVSSPNHSSSQSSASVFAVFADEKVDDQIVELEDDNLIDQAMASF